MIYVYTVYVYISHMDKHFSSKCKIMDTKLGVGLKNRKKTEPITKPKPKKLNRTKKTKPNQNWLVRFSVLVVSKPNRTESN